MFGVNRPPLCVETNFLGTRDTSVQIYGTKQLTEDVFKSNVKTSILHIHCFENMWIKDVMQSHMEFRDFELIPNYGKISLSLGFLISNRTGVGKMGMLLVC